MTRHTGNAASGKRWRRLGRNPVDRAVLTTSRYRGYVPLVLALIVIVAALWGYRGTNARLLGPPLGKLLGQDFRQVLRAAREAEAGENLYEHAIAFGRSPDFGEFMSWDAAPYPYPPVVAVLARPLSWLPTDVALQLWTGVNLALVLSSALLAVRSFTGVGLRRSLGSLFLILTLFYVYGPTQIDLKLVQLDILILFLVLLTYWLYRSGNGLAGMPLAFAIAIKPVVAPMLVFFAWKREWRMFFLALLLTGVLTALGFCVVGWERLPDYLEVSRLWAGGPMLAFPFNQSPRGFALRLFGTNIYSEPLYEVPWLAWLLPVAVGLLAAGGWLAGVTRAGNRGKPASGIEYGLTVTTMMLLWPLVDDIHFVWVLLPLSASLLVAIDDLRDLQSFLPLMGSLAIALWLSYPDLHDAIYVGWESLAVRGTLVERSSVLYTGAYLYGLIALDFSLVLCLVLQRTRNR